MEGAVFIPCCLTWGQTMMEVMKIMVTSFKRSHACTAWLSAPNLAAGHQWPTPLPETPGHSWASLGQSLVGSLLLSPGMHKVLFVSSNSLFPQCCVSSGSSMVGLMATSSKRRPIICLTLLFVTKYRTLYSVPPVSCLGVNTTWFYSTDFVVCFSIWQGKSHSFVYVF